MPLRGSRTARLGGILTRSVRQARWAATGSLISANILEVSMRTMYRFLLSTLVGGLVVLVPIVVLGGVVGWAIDVALKVIMPVFAWLPDRSVGGVSLTAAVAVGSLIGACFLAGLGARTAI